MMYEIQNKSDFQVGATLTVKVPEADIDKKAMNTILSERPDFALPFRHRLVDGQVEFTYLIGNRSKIAYLSGNRSPAEYADMWFGILQPLLDCSDWFMTPYSFVLAPEHLYFNKATNTVCFVYIPSVHACSDEYALKAMVTEVAKLNHVTDVNLENKVVWAIQDFNINSFLQMVKTFKAHNKSEVSSSLAVHAVPQPEMPVQEEAKHITPPASLETPPLPLKISDRINKQSDEISINFPADGKAPQDKKSKGGLFGFKKEKEVKPKAEPKDKGGGLLGKKKMQQDIIDGAAAMPAQQLPPQASVFPPAYAPTSAGDGVTEPLGIDDDVTELDMIGSDGAKLRYVGAGEHPRVIEVEVNEGAIFTIGRFDASVGTKQSSFEFDKKTKAVSRRHAAIERSADGYSIVDLDSGAGTFLNGQKLPANAPFKLERGFRVSFGHSGADYMWEE